MTLPAAAHPKFILISIKRINGPLLHAAPLLYAQWFPIINIAPVWTLPGHVISHRYILPWLVRLFGTKLINSRHGNYQTENTNSYHTDFTSQFPDLRYKGWPGILFPADIQYSIRLSPHFYLADIKPTVDRHTLFSHFAFQISDDALLPKTCTRAQ